MDANHYLTDRHSRCYSCRLTYNSPFEPPFSTERMQRGWCGRCSIKPLLPVNLDASSVACCRRRKQQGWATRRWGKGGIVQGAGIANHSPLREAQGYRLEPVLSQTVVIERTSWERWWLHRRCCSSISSKARVWLASKIWGSQAN